MQSNSVSIGIIALAFSGTALAAPIQVDLSGPAEGSGSVGWRQPAVSGDQVDSSTGVFVTPLSQYVNSFYIGWGGSAPNRMTRVMVLFYELPERPDGAVFTDATFSVTTSAGRFQPLAVDLWGVGHRPTPTLATEHWFAGSPDDSWFEEFAGTGDNIDDQVRIQEAFIPAFPEGFEESDLGEHTTSAAGGSALAGFLNLLYDQGAQAGDYAVLRLNFDTFVNTNVTANTHSWTFDPEGFSLQATLVPEPGMLSFAAAAGTLALLRRRRPQAA